MPGSHWMIVMSPENFEITRERGFDLVGLKSRHRKKAERMALGDRVLFYVAGSQVFPLTATVTSTFFEDHTPIWVSTERRPDVAPWRVQVRADVVLNWYEYLDARQIAPRMLYVKRWAPEDWPLAFQGQIHLLSSQDFALIEHEMRRTIDRRGRGGGSGHRIGHACQPRTEPPSMGLTACDHQCEDGHVVAAPRVWRTVSQPTAMVRSQSGRQARLPIGRPDAARANLVRGAATGASRRPRQV